MAEHVMRGYRYVDGHRLGRDRPGAVAASDRKARGRRTIDLFIAATALAADLPLYTRNPVDFAGLSQSLVIVAV